MANNLNQEQKIVIVGAGFGGVRCALDLAKKRIPNANIILINDKPYFEYTPALYRVVTGRSPLGACVRLQDIFQGIEVEVLEDTIERVDLSAKQLKGAAGSTYNFDFLVLVLGSETNYFNTPGLKDLSFSSKSINEALRLKRHLHEMFDQCIGQGSSEQKVCSLHFVIVGGGATGTELTGELAFYAIKLAKKHNIEPSLVTIDLIEAGPRILSALPEKISEKVTHRLRHLGANIFLNRGVVKEDLEQVYLKDMEMKTKTVIWTAGVKPNHLYAETAGFELNQRGRVIVDEHLHAKGFSDVFVLGDAAATPYSGMAQTAIHEGAYIADAIYRQIRGEKIPTYVPQKPSIAMPVGPNWAAVLINSLRFYGQLGWWLRRLADLRFFLTILPLSKAFNIFFSSKNLCEACQICEVEK